MRVAMKLVPVVVLGLIAGACASGGGGGGTGGTARTDYTVLTREQLQAAGDMTLLEAVQKLRPNWLLVRGQSSVPQTGMRSDVTAGPGEVVVMLNGVRAGGPSALENLQVRTVDSLKYIDGVAAAARWGLCCGNGVILVSTTPNPAAP